MRISVPEQEHQSFVDAHKFHYNNVYQQMLDFRSLKLTLLGLYLWT